MSSELRIKTDYIRAWHKCALKTGSDADHAILEIAENFDAIRSALTGPAGTGGGGGEKERAFWDEVRRRDNEVVKHLTELGAANTAFHAGWVSRADHRALKSRLAAAEKRAEEAERIASNRAGMVGRVEDQVREGNQRQARLVSERDSIKAELDAAKRTAHITMSHIILDDVEYTPEKIRALEAELAEAKAECATWMKIARGTYFDDFKIITLHGRSERDWLAIGNVMEQHMIGDAERLATRLSLPNALASERDSLKAELDKAKARLDELDRFDVLGMTGRLNTALSERDSALARVKELDEVMKNIVLSLSHVKPTIREAAGAQP